MTKRILKWLSYLLLLCAVIFAWLILLPRDYHVPVQQERAGTQYWDLSTGSRIAFTYLQAKGPKKPYPVIYLHGGPGGVITSRQINSLRPLAEDGYDVYLYDQVGSGLSSRLDNIRLYTAQRHVKDLEEIIRKTGSSKAILIGQSWGGILATMFIAQNPGMVAKTIFTCPGPVCPARYELASEPSPDSLHLRAPYYSNRQGNLKMHNTRTQTVTLVAQWFGVKLASDEEADKFLTFLNNETNRSMVCDTSLDVSAVPGSGFYSHVMTMESLHKVDDIRPKLRYNKMPVLVMKGQCDNQPWGYTNEYLDLFVNHQLVVIPGAGHAINMEQPGLYIQTIRTFLK